MADETIGNLSEGTDSIYGSAMSSLGRSGNTFLRLVAAQRVTLGTLCTITTGAGMDTSKDWEKEKMEERLRGAKKKKEETE